MRKQNKVSIAVMAFIVLIIIGISSCGGSATPGGNSGSPSGSPVGSPSGPPAVTASSVPTTAPPPQTTAPAAPTTAAPPPPTTAPAAAPSTPSGCYPLTNGGNCYEPGEYCRKSDHGASGVAGDGKPIICEDNDGWRWEPA
jgi:hypothetical protein